jgi:hypothetical protein
VRETDYFEGLGSVGNIIINWMFKNGMQGMDWIHLAQDRNR